MIQKKAMNKNNYNNSNNNNNKKLTEYREITKKW